MKKILFTLLSLVIAAPLALAVPANPAPFKYTQPDGSVLTLQVHGDEFFNWVTNYNTGEVVKLGADGFYRPDSEPLSAKAARGAEARNTANRQRRSPRFRSMWSSYDDHPSTNIGSPRILCVLVQFSDGEDFTVENPLTHFANMLNQEGYSYNGAIGSVRDYYMDNSANQYSPTFDVYGPVTVSQTKGYCSDYLNGRNNMRMREAVVEAVQTLVDNSIITDIDQYDNDDDGTLDMILCYYPGHNPAEGGDQENVWPHQSTASGTVGTKAFGKYFCTSELRGKDGTEAASIGTTCHEFAHSLGLPDFYDTDYATNGYNMYTTVTFDVMAAGSYNDNGRKPPYMSALERNMLGWQTAPIVISASGDYFLDAVQKEGVKGYRINGRMEGEYYLVECRDGEKWDSGILESANIVKGMLLYHVDMSTRPVYDGYTAADLWESTNSINMYGPGYGRPCFTLLTQDEAYSNPSLRCYPGFHNVTSLSLYDWDDLSIGVDLSDIEYDDMNGQVFFHADFTSDKTVYGYVTNANGDPIENAQVVLTQSEVAFAAPALLPNDVVCYTNAQGLFSFTLENTATDYQILTVRKEGYVTLSANVTAANLYARHDFTLLVPGDGGIASLKKYDLSGGAYVSYKSADSQAYSVRFTAEELEQRGVVGAKLASMSFTTLAECEHVYALIYFGTERVFLGDVTAIYTAAETLTLDLTPDDLYIPADTDVYIGFGLENITSANTAYLTPSTYSYGTYSMDNFLDANPVWVQNNYGSPMSYLISANLALVSPITPATYGVSYIALEAGVPTVKVASGKSLQSISWYLDGNPVVGTPTSVNDLEDGSHTYMARISYYDGTSERVYYDVDK